MQHHSLFKNLPPLDRQTDRQTARQMTGWKNGQTHRWKKGNEDEQIIL